MDFKVVTFGKPGSKLIQQEIEKFSKRMRGVCGFEMLHLKESSRRTPKEKLQEESQLFQKKVGIQSTLCVMAEEGKSMTTVELAKWMERTSERGPINFLIGSAYGIDEELKNQADIKLSLSPLTFTHDHAMIILVEQIYRCMMVLRNHPYHHV